HPHEPRQNCSSPSSESRTGIPTLSYDLQYLSSLDCLIRCYDESSEDLVEYGDLKHQFAEHFIPLGCRFSNKCLTDFGQAISGTLCLDETKRLSGLAVI